MGGAHLALELLVARRPRLALVESLQAPLAGRVDEEEPFDRLTSAGLDEGALGEERHVPHRPDSTLFIHEPHGRDLDNAPC